MGAQTEDPAGLNTTLAVARYMAWPPSLDGKKRMRRKSKFLFGLLLGFSLWLGASVNAIAGSLPETIAKVKPSIVGIGTFHPTRAPRSRLYGTGFVVGNGRHVVTNDHVVNKPLDIEHQERWVVFVGHGATPAVRGARTVVIDREHDLTLLEIEGKALPAMTLGQSSRVREGELYAFTGFPIGAILGLYPATHRGLIAAITPIVIPKDRAEQLDLASIQRLRNPYDVFQLDATAYPGNSGSPLYDIETGAVVGVINQVFVKETKESVLSEPSGITYAIPATFVKQLLERAP